LFAKFKIGSLSFIILWWQVYALSKLLTEEAAFKFAQENGIDIVSVITSTVAGPFFTANVPSSVKVLLSPLTGDFIINLHVMHQDTL
jgi:nucleoside-diphosphate-sugar epimerase